MKNLIKMVKGTDKLGYKLSAICGIKLAGWSDV